MLKRGKTKRVNVPFRQQSRRIKIAKLLTVLTVLVGATVIFVRVYAEQSGSSPESGVTSYTKSLYTTLQAAGYGSDTNTPNWGTYWNRISTSAQWAPSGTAVADDVVYGKTFVGSGRNILTGTYGGNAAVSDVASGKTFYGTTGVQQTGTYTPVVSGNCPTQAYHDSYGAPVTQTTNCTANITWTVPGGGITGTDKQDPVSKLIWSQILINTAGTIGFTTTLTPTNFTWNSSGAENTSRTAIQLCSDRGNGWRLPTQKELMQAYVDGDYFKFTQQAQWSYWSSTQFSSTYAWQVSDYDGSLYAGSMNNGAGIRCVR